MLITFLLVLVFASVAGAQKAPSCFGLSPTLTLPCAPGVLHDNNTAEVILGSACDDTVFLRPDDTFCGNGGNDTVDVIGLETHQTTYISVEDASDVSCGDSRSKCYIVGGTGDNVYRLGAAGGMIVDPSGNDFYAFPDHTDVRIIDIGPEHDIAVGTPTPMSLLSGIEEQWP